MAATACEPQNYDQIQPGFDCEEGLQMHILPGESDMTQAQAEVIIFFLLYMLFCAAGRTLLFTRCRRFPARGSLFCYRVAAC